MLKRQLFPRLYQLFPHLATAVSELYELYSQHASVFRRLFQKRPNIPPSSLFTGGSVWGTSEWVPHRLPIGSPFSSIFSTLILCSVIVIRQPLMIINELFNGNYTFILSFNQVQGGVYGETGGNLKKGSPPRKPFTHRHSERFVGNGEPSPIFVLSESSSTKSATTVIAALNEQSYCFFYFFITLRVVPSFIG